MTEILAAVDRALALAHRTDDKLCGCDSCMEYWAEDEGINWFGLTAARRIVLRVLDSGDDRFEPLVRGISEHDEALANHSPDCPGTTGMPGDGWCCEKEAQRASHYPTGEYTDGAPVLCANDGQTWPCATARAGGWPVT